MIRGYLINEFGEKVGCYNINGRNEYIVSMYHNKIGYMTEKQLVAQLRNMKVNTKGLFLPTTLQIGVIEE